MVPYGEAKFIQRHTHGMYEFCSKQPGKSWGTARTGPRSVMWLRHKIEHLAGSTWAFSGGCLDCDFHYWSASYFEHWYLKIDNLSVNSSVLNDQIRVDLTRGQPWMSNPILSLLMSSGLPGWSEFQWHYMSVISLQINGINEQVSFKKEVGVMVIDLVFWLTVCLILKMCY